MARSQAADQMTDTMDLQTSRDIMLQTSPQQPSKSTGDVRGFQRSALRPIFGLAPWPTILMSVVGHVGAQRSNAFFQRFAFALSPTYDRAPRFFSY